MFTDTWIFVSNFKLKRSKHGSTQVLPTGFHISTVTKERLIMDFILMTISFEGTAGLRWEEEFAIFSLGNRIWVTKTGYHRKKKSMGPGFGLAYGIYSTPNPSEPSGFDLKYDLKEVKYISYSFGSIKVHSNSYRTTDCCWKTKYQQHHAIDQYFQQRNSTTESIP